MAERTVRLGSVFFIDSDGKPRRGSAGDKVSVHPEYVERFDRLNVLLGEEAPKPEQPRRRTSKAKAED